MNEINELIEKVASEAEAAGLDASAEDLAELALDKIAQEDPDDDDVDDAIKTAVDLASEVLPDEEPEKIAEIAYEALEKAAKKREENQYDGARKIPYWTTVGGPAGVQGVLSLHPKTRGIAPFAALVPASPRSTRFPRG